MGKKLEVTYELDKAKIEEEKKYDGYYAVATNLKNDKAKEILAITHKRYQIEDCFRIMKTNFDARPVFHSKEDRIRAHFLICYTALLVYRLLEGKLDDIGAHVTTSIWDSAASSAFIFSAFTSPASAIDAVFFVAFAISFSCTQSVLFFRTNVRS